MSSSIERDGKPWTVADIDRLERERDDYKDRWETLGRVARQMLEMTKLTIDHQAREIQVLRSRIDPPNP